MLRSARQFAELLRIATELPDEEFQRLLDKRPGVRSQLKRLNIYAGQLRQEMDLHRWTPSFIAAATGEEFNYRFLQLLLDLDWLIRATLPPQRRCTLDDRRTPGKSPSLN